MGECVVMEMEEGEAHQHPGDRGVKCIGKKSCKEGRRQEVCKPPGLTCGQECRHKSQDIFVRSQRSTLAESSHMFGLWIVPCPSLFATRYNPADHPTRGKEVPQPVPNSIIGSVDPCLLFGLFKVDC